MKTLIETFLATVGSGLGNCWRLEDRNEQRMKRDINSIEVCGGFGRRENRSTRHRRVIRLVLVGVAAFLVQTIHCVAQDADAPGWRKHVILSVKKCYNVVAADFTGDGLTDVMANKVDATMLLVAHAKRDCSERLIGLSAPTGAFGAQNKQPLVAPDWKLVEVETTRGIHVYASGAMDVDADGDLDYVAGRYSPGLLFWLECPDAPTRQPWLFHVIDDQPDGVHGILLKDLDGDGRLDMVTNSAHRKGPLPQSILWYQVAQDPRRRWTRNVLGKRTAPGRPHYFASGDFNADGRVDVAVASSGVSLPGGDWLAWWEAPKKRADPWKKHLIADGQVGATHLHAADFNGDGRLDFIASMGHGQGVYWFEAPGWKRHVIDSTLRDVHCLVAADLDGDGDVDAATVSRKDFVAAWFENDGQGRFTRHIIDAKQSAYDMCAADMDRDGDLDLVIAGAESDNVVWLENPVR